jgi:hypothetical protein
MLPATTAVHQYSENFLPRDNQDLQRTFLSDIEAGRVTIVAVVKQ